jgi:hypothetical protein
MTTFYGFTCDTPNAELRAVVEYAIGAIRHRIDRQPVAVHMHPDNIRRFIAIHGDWPANWPMLVENVAIGPHQIGIEPGAPDRHSPQQLRLV